MTPVPRELRDVIDPSTGEPHNGWRPLGSNVYFKEIDGQPVQVSYLEALGYGTERQRDKPRVRLS